MKGALQDRMLPFGRTCFGCGGENEHGLRIKSFVEGDEVVCDFDPEPWHIAAPGFINGGVVATLLDCHSAAAAVHAAYQAEGREVGSAPDLFYVTATLKVDYLRPTPSGKRLHLRASSTGVEGRKSNVVCSLLADGVETARAETVFVRVDR